MVTVTVDFIFTSGWRYRRKVDGGFMDKRERKGEGGSTEQFGIKETSKDYKNQTRTQYL